jgi:hypothetical protein
MMGAMRLKYQATKIIQVGAMAKFAKQLFGYYGGDYLWQFVCCRDAKGVDAF